MQDGGAARLLLRVPCCRTAHAPGPTQQTVPQAFAGATGAGRVTPPRVLLLDSCCDPCCCVIETNTLQTVSMWPCNRDGCVLRRWTRWPRAQARELLEVYRGLQQAEKEVLQAVRDSEWEGREISRTRNTQEQSIARREAP